MQIQYLGTAAAEGWPGLFCACPICQEARRLGGKNIRTRSQAVIDDALLMDFPPDTYLHVLRDGLPLHAIRDVLITHTHSDHLHLDDISFRRSTFSNTARDTGVMTLHGNDALARKYDALLAAMRPDAQAQMRAVLACQEITPFVPHAVGAHTVTPLLALHDRRERCYIYLIERDGKALLYGNDTGIFPQETWDYLRGHRLDLVSLDCTMLRHKEGSNHLGIDDVLEVKGRLADMGSADARTTFVITHFSHNGGLLHHEIEARVAPEGVIVAYDGLTVRC